MKCLLNAVIIELQHRYESKDIHEVMYVIYLTSLVFLNPEKLGSLELLGVLIPTEEEVTVAKVLLERIKLNYFAKQTYSHNVAKFLSVQRCISIHVPTCRFHCRSRVLNCDYFVKVVSRHLQGSTNPSIRFRNEKQISSSFFGVSEKSNPLPKSSIR